MTHLALVLLLLAAPGDKARENAASGGPSPSGVRTVVLDDKNVGKVFRIRTARNLLTTVEFPEEMLSTPECGDCADGKGTSEDALFLLETEAQGRYLTIRPNSAAGRRARTVDDDATSVLVRLEHSTLTLYVERVEQKKADTRVIFAYPNRDADDEYLRVERAKLEAELTSKLEAEVTGRFLQAFSEPHKCARKGARARNDDVVLEVTELCYFGRDVIVTFTVENRSRDPLDLASVVVNKGANKREYLSQKTVEFQKISSGVVALELADGENPAGPYEVTVSEGGVKGRAVTLTGLEF